MLAEPVLCGSEESAANLALKLTAFTVVAVKVLMRGSAFWTDAILRYVAGFALVALYRLDDLAISMAIVVEQAFPGPAVLMVLELRQDIRLELLVVRRLRIIRCELFQRDIFGDESHQPCNLCVEVIDFIEKQLYNGHEQ